MEERKVTFSIQEDPEMIERIDERARAEGTSRSAIVRRALRVFFLASIPESGNDSKVENAAESVAA